MKQILKGLTVVSLAVLTGCTQGTPGGPGTSDKAGKPPAYGQADDTFNLSVPVLSSALQQGQKADAIVGIKRAKNFDQDVTLQFADIPQGVTVEPMDPVIKHGDTDAKIRFQATEEALLGDYKIKVTGHPTKGGDALVEFKLTVSAIDNFTLSVPLLSSTLKQGETKTASIGIKREKNFDQTVRLTFGDLPTGVTLKAETADIKHGDTDVQILLTAAPDAALGNFTIKVTGHPAKGLDTSSDFKLTVVK